MKSRSEERCLNFSLLYHSPSSRNTMLCSCRTSLSVLSRQATIQRVSVVRRTFVSSTSIFAKPASPPPAAATAEPSKPYFYSSILLCREKSDQELVLWDYLSVLAPSTSSSSLSSCPEGTVLKGLNYLKDESPILSKPDSEYPEWLWSLASAPEEGGSGGAVKKSKKSGKKVGASSGISPEEAEQQARMEELKRQKRELKLEGRKAIKASNVLRG